MMKEFTIWHRHGKQFVPDLRHAVLPEIFRGRPLIEADISSEESRAAADCCPVGAITADPCSLDLGRCIFCRECEFITNRKIRFTRDYRIATNERSELIIKQGEDRPIQIVGAKVRKEVRTLFRQALKLRQVSAGGDNSAEMELNAAGNVNFDMGRYGIEFVASPRHADGVVITGPVTVNMAEALEMCFHAIPSPRIIILAGSDAIGGGLFRESSAINRQFISQYPVDLFVPGNPPHPLTFINGVLDLTRGSLFSK